MSKVKEWMEEKAAEVKAFTEVQLWKLEMWAIENPQQAAAIACTAIGATGIVIRRIDRSVRLHRETMLKDRYIYDRSLGRYWKLRRKPTQKEALKIESLRKAGLGYGDILMKLKLL